MSIPKKVRDYLENNHVTYWRKIHPLAYTAQELAQVDRVPGREIAKTVVLRADDRFVMAVLPADLDINMELLKAELRCKRLMLAAEAEFAPLFPECQLGAMPPFGGLFGMPVYCDRRLASRREIEFNGGSHTETLRMSFEEFDLLERPTILDFAERLGGRDLARIA
jgi:Ala-tRNA(Pro) deacylase